MFHIASKLLAWFLEPVTWFLLLQSVALLLIVRRRHRAAGVVLAGSVILLVVLTQLPVPGLLIRPLEQAYPAPRDLPADIDGIIVLGGSLDPILSRIYGKPQLGADAERLTEFIALARQMPKAKLVLSGGAAAIWGDPISEAEESKVFLEQQGLDTRRVLFDHKSRSTLEHPGYIDELVRRAPGERWLLVTSAFHMPRALAVFRKAGWDPIPYPVSYRASPDYHFSWSGDRDYLTLSIAIREWVGIVMYRLAGKL